MRTNLLAHATSTHACWFTSLRYTRHIIHRHTVLNIIHRHTMLMTTSSNNCRASPAHASEGHVYVTCDACVWHVTHVCDV